MTFATSALLTDLYQLNMIQAYVEHGQTETAVFEFFVRNVPHGVDSSSPPAWRRCSAIWKLCGSRPGSSSG